MGDVEMTGLIFILSLLVAVTSTAAIYYKSKYEELKK